MATTKNIAWFVNQIPEDRTRRAVQAIVEKIIADGVTNKAIFDAHVHKARTMAGTSASYDTSAPRSDTADVTTGTATTFTTTVTS